MRGGASNDIVAYAVSQLVPGASVGWGKLRAPVDYVGSRREALVETKKNLENNQKVLDKKAWVG